MKVTGCEPSVCSCREGTDKSSGRTQETPSLLREARGDHWHSSRDLGLQWGLQTSGQREQRPWGRYGGWQVARGCGWRVCGDRG